MALIMGMMVVLSVVMVNCVDTGFIQALVLVLVK